MFSLAIFFISNSPCQNENDRKEFFEDEMRREIDGKKQFLQWILSSRANI